MNEKSFSRFSTKLVLNQDTGCLLWTSVITHDGYGRFKLGGRYVRAHRASYEHWVASIPAGLVVDHLCRVRNCCAPDHLDLVTPAENTARGRPARGLANNNGRKTRCPSGHEYTERNTRLYRGRRYCRECQAESNRTHKPRVRQ